MRPALPGHSGYPGYPDSHCEAQDDPKELCLMKNQLIRVVPYIGREYSITFELYLYSYPTQAQNMSSVLHFTAGGNNYHYGDRNPAVWVSGQEDNPEKIVVSSSVDGNTNLHVYSEKTYPLKTWIPIKISQKLVGKEVC